MMMQGNTSSIQENVNVLVLMLVAAVILSVGLSFSFNTMRDLVSENKTRASSDGTTLNPPSFYRAYENESGTAQATKKGLGSGCASSTITDTDGTTLSAACAGTYRAMKADDFTGLLVNLPFFITLGAVVALFGVGAFQTGSGTIVDKILAGFLILVIGGTLLVIMNIFIDGVVVKYRDTAMSSVTSVVGLMTLAVGISLVLGAISIAAGGKTSLGAKVVGAGLKKYGNRGKRRGRRAMYGM